MSLFTKCTTCKPLKVQNLQGKIRDSVRSYILTGANLGQQYTTCPSLVVFCRRGRDIYLNFFDMQTKRRLFNLFIKVAKCVGYDNSNSQNKLHKQKKLH